MPLFKSESHNPSKLKKYVKQDLNISKYFPITHLNSASIFEASNGCIGSVIGLEGVPFDTEMMSFIKKNHQLWQQAIKNLDDTIALHVTLHRHKIKNDLEGEFVDDFCRKVDKQYHAQFQGRSMYQNVIYLTVIYKGITAGKTGKLFSVWKKLSEKTVKSARAIRRQQQIKALEKAVTLLISQLSVFKPHLLGSRDQQLGYSELTTFLALIVNGGEKIQFRSPTTTAPIFNDMNAVSKCMHLYPQGFLAQYLSRKRLFFGTSIQFQGATTEDCQFAAMLSIKQYSEETHVLVLDPLLDLDCEFISTHTFALLSQEEAKKQAKNRGIQLRSAEDDSHSQIAALDELRDQIASNETIMGYHHHSLMILANTKAELETKINHASACYSASGIMVVREDIGQQAAFWAQIPTNFNMIARNAIITSHNFTDFCPLHNYRHGYRDGNHLGAAVTLLETPSKTPFFFNYHLQNFSSDRKSPTNGHTLIIGATGAGKTAFMSFMDAQTSRYGGKTFVFDRKRGLDIYIRATGGYYTCLSPNDTSVQFNPLQLEDTALNRQFCADWLAQLVKNEDKPVLEQETLEAIKECIDYNFTMLSKEHRVLSNTVKRLPANFPRWPALRRWLRKSGKYEEGVYAYLFDNPVDNFHIYNKMGFDMTHFLDNESSLVRATVMMYIMHRLKLSMDGTLMSIYMDEGWQYLDDPWWKAKLQEFFGSFRSKNVHIIFATQSPETVSKSPLNGVIINNIATSIFFGNTTAKAEDYTAFGLTQEEFLAIKNVPVDKRLFLVKQKEMSSLCTLNLNCMPELLPILSSNEANLKLCDQIRLEVGNDPREWIPIFLVRSKR